MSVSTQRLHTLLALLPVFSAAVAVTTVLATAITRAVGDAMRWLMSTMVMTTTTTTHNGVAVALALALAVAVAVTAALDLILQRRSDGADFRLQAFGESWFV